MREGISLRTAERSGIGVNSDKNKQVIFANMKMRYANGGKFLMNSEKKFQDMAGAGSGINMAYANRNTVLPGKLRKLSPLHYLAGGDKGRAIRQEKRYLKKLDRQGKLNDYGTQSQDRLDYLKSLQKHRAKKAAAGIGAAALIAGTAGLATGALGAGAAGAGAAGAAGGAGAAGAGAAGAAGAGAAGAGAAGAGAAGAGAAGTAATGAGTGFGGWLMRNAGNLGKGLGQFAKSYNAADPRLQQQQGAYTVDTDGDGIFDAENGVRLNKRRKRKGMDIGALAMLLNQAQQARDIGGLKMRVKKAAPRRRGSSAAGRFFSKRAR